MPTPEPDWKSASTELHRDDPRSPGPERGRTEPLTGGVLAFALFALLVLLAADYYKGWQKRGRPVFARFSVGDCYVAVLPGKQTGEITKVVGKTDEGDYLIRYASPGAIDAIGVIAEADFRDRETAAKVQFPKVSCP